MAAQQQGKFWEFHDKVFANQKKIKSDDLMKYAREIGLDMKRFEEDLVSPKTRAIVDADVAEAKSLGVTGTPGFFINGRYLSGAQPFERVRGADQRRAREAQHPGARGSGAGAEGRLA